MKPTVQYDLVVVGAGPGGSSAAREAARQGLRVLLLERQREVPHVVQCAEGISHASLVEGFSASVPGIATVIHRARFHFPSGTTFEVAYPKVGYILDRKIFDRYLAVQAVLQGAELRRGAIFQKAFHENGTIRVLFTEGHHLREVSTRLVIGADGPASTVGKSLGLPLDVEDKEIHKAHQYFVAHPHIEEDCVEFFIGETWAPGGYGWIFPKGPGYGNVGVGLIASDPRDPKSFTERLLDQYLPGAQILGETASIIPTGGLHLPLVGDQIMVVGDAARLADPLTAGGIPAALISGSLAGRVAAKALREPTIQPQILEEYPRTFWKDRRSDYIFMSHLRDFFLSLTDEDLDELGFHLKKVLDGVTLDTLDTVAVGRQILTRNPKLLTFLIKKGYRDLAKYLRETLLRA